MVLTMSNPVESRLVAPKPFKKALAAYNRGDLVKAETLCLAALKSKPEFFDALHLLAIVQSRRGRYALALEIFDKAIRLRPDDTELINNRGSALTEAKRYDEALAAYEKAIALRPDYADAYNNHGCVLMEMQHFDDAMTSYSKALVLDPNNPEYINNLGRSLTRLRRYTDALDCYEDALALRPDYVEALINRGVTLTEVGRHDEALACFDSIPAHAGSRVDILVHRANALSGAHRFEEALTACDRLLALYPDRRPETLLRRGVVLSKLRRFDDAFKSYDEALTLKAEPADVLMNRIGTFLEMGCVDQALEGAQQALVTRPDSAPVHNLHGFVLMTAERFPEAIASFRTAILLRGEYPEATWNLGWMLLLLGDFAEGWRHYEVRRIRTTWTKLKGPEWRGEPLEGKRLLLYAEQGFGDALQFARFVRLTARMGAQVALGVYAPVAALFSMMDEKPVIVRHGEMAPDCDYHAPIMSMPFILGLDEKTIPAEMPYLRADQARVATWKARLPQSKYSVGIAWQGSKSDPTRWAPLAAFAPLSRVPGVTLISLQKTDGLEQLEDLPPEMQVETLGPDFDAGPDAFLDTAAVMMNLDLIVTIDTAIAHLAGALGRSVWIALKRVPEWRWMLGRDDSPWYPTARLFRQTRAGDWAAVMEKIASELAQLASAKSATAESSDDR
jgi:tetratricopeptide (TPR) repeat protein